MKVLLWQMRGGFHQIVLWDGENTYWTEEMKPSTGYKHLKMGKFRPVTGSQFILLGEL